MIEINWTIITYFVIGFFIISGWFKGWWKEAITTFFLGILVFLLSNPDVAQWIIERANDVISPVVNWLPELIQNFLITLFGVNKVTDLQLNASSGQTWLVILILFLSLSILISGPMLPNQMDFPPYTTYIVTPLGAFLGGLLGGLNGFLIINLVREYLTGSFLPLSPVSGVAAVAGATVGSASSGVDFLVTDLPRFTSLDSIAAWVIIVFGLVIALLTFKNRQRLPGYIPATVEKKEKEKNFVIDLVIFVVEKGTGH